MDQLEKEGVDCELISLYGKKIEPCHGCRACQTDWEHFTCRFDDDAVWIAEKLLESDLIVLASPIYSWYCTAPLKALMDRLVYGCNKYYGEKKGPALLAGRRVAIVTTCGYPLENGTGLWEEGVKHYCNHSALKYSGMLAERHMGYNTTFMDSDKEAHARAFAETLARQLKEEQ